MILRNGLELFFSCVASYYRLMSHGRVTVLELVMKPGFGLFWARRLQPRQKEAPKLSGRFGSEQDASVSISRLHINLSIYKMIAFTRPKTFYVGEPILGMPF
jgi:hypothetical protein